MSRSRMIQSLVVLVVFVIGLAAPVGASAQSSQGGLRGVVKDAQGVIPGVTVILLNDATGVARETVTNESGEYSFPAVEPSTYTVKVSVQGFRSFERQGVRISTQQFVGLDIVLEVGTLSETITVTADAPLIESTNASVGGVIDSKALEAIPTAGRSVFLRTHGAGEW
jgi:trimeric autotransporter adhesin